MAQKEKIGHGVSSADPARTLESLEGFNEGRRNRDQIVALGEFMRELRADVLEITQTEAAGLMGIEQSELSRFESGTGVRGPSYSTLMRVVEAYQKLLRDRDEAWDLDLAIRLRHPEQRERELRAGSD